MLNGLSKRRRIQLVLLFGLMILGALAEIMALGAILPFLALIADPAGLERMPMIGRFLSGLSSDQFDLRWVVTWGFVSAAAIAAVLRLFLNWASQKFVFRVSHDIGTSVFQRALRQPYLYYLSRNSSELMADMGKVPTIALNILLPLMNAVVSLVISAFILAALIVIDPKVAMITGFGFGVLYLIISLVFRRRLRHNSHVIAEAHGERIKTLQEGLGAIRDVLIDHSQPYYERRFARMDLPFQDTIASNAFLGSAPRFVIEGSGMILIAFVALWLAGQPGGIATALPILGALALGAVRLLPMLQLIYNSWSSIAGNRQNLIDVVTAMELPLPELHPIIAPMPFASHILFDEVGFLYPTGQTAILRGLNLTIPRGSRVGIIGRTGSGKSTLMDMLLGLLAPSEGRILIDGIELRPDNIAAWQARIAHVPQSIYLADSSVAENIAFGIARDQVDMARVRLAAQQAALDGFIEALPQRYNTFVGERGVRLSGGQRQRIGIARALYRQADVLVLDEATSALDSGTETAVMEAIDGLSKDLTIFLIAHRTTTLRNCDIILCLPEGGVIPYDEIATMGQGIESISKN